jgi:hypothetical protein
MRKFSLVIFFAYCFALLSPSSVKAQERCEVSDDMLIADASIFSVGAAGVVTAIALDVAGGSPPGFLPQSPLNDAASAVGLSSAFIVGAGLIVLWSHFEEVQACESSEQNYGAMMRCHARLALTLVNPRYVGLWWMIVPISARNPT